MANDAKQDGPAIGTPSVTRERKPLDPKFRAFLDQKCGISGVALDKLELISHEPQDILKSIIEDGAEAVEDRIHKTIK